ncbi:MAG: methionine-R-sulfoxide reductase [Saprospiraceae bacterium]|jgi:methionine-R-sulfoxide reductase|nr:methionine-R-sulfoxide reductase [Saprospiraceae bacterium]MBK7797218.1 methionine-R-sulfoxide reductase [Saprospiraceae bacterium]MBK8151966.1 methionine-R-sulfoxide reductase [Saprospiraceae bacterium]MBK9377293.1 methionine-R-sulfoxide reductase [Saprospiraceae bacterium]MBL0261693.1 methionine-R-sulfoxide reductase [Saprospiraceae bacterium]
MGWNELTEEEKYIIEGKGTEVPFSGVYNLHFENGVYLCRRCNAKLFDSEEKFNSYCGWPSFDEAIKDAVLQLPDKDRVRTEILCASCNAHLGHVFFGERLTPKNQRFCVNSTSLSFQQK